MFFLNENISEFPRVKFMLSALPTLVEIAGGRSGRLVRHVQVRGKVLL